MRPILVLTALVACGSIDPLPAPAKQDDGYGTRTIEGWTVRAARPLLEEKSEVGREAIRLLETKLYEITRVVPGKAVAELRKVPIWLCVGEGTKGGGGAEYHPSESWLRDNGYDPLKAKAVEIGDAPRFLEFSIPQPMEIGR